MPRPPCRTGSAMSGLSVAASSIEEFKRAGRKTWEIAISSGAKA